VEKRMMGMMGIGKTHDGNDGNVFPCITMQFAYSAWQQVFRLSTTIKSVICQKAVELSEVLLC
jgi:hypothetical protein